MQGVYHKPKHIIGAESPYHLMLVLLVFWSFLNTLVKRNVVFIIVFFERGDDTMNRKREGRMECLSVSDKATFSVTVPLPNFQPIAP